MAPPIKAELRSHNPSWSQMAEDEANSLMAAIGPNVRIVHHVGSTAIPSISAKPILDLMPVVSEFAELEIAKM